MQDIDKYALRRDQAYKALNDIVDSFKKVKLFPVLTWVYVWDVVRDIFEHASIIENDGWDEYKAAEGVTLKQVWDRLFETADETQFSLEYGTETLYESIHDWMIDNDFIVMTDREEIYDDND